MRRLIVYPLILNLYLTQLGLKTHEKNNVHSVDQNLYILGSGFFRRLRISLGVKIQNNLRIFISSMSHTIFLQCKCQYSCIRWVWCQNDVGGVRDIIKIDQN